MAFSPSTLNNAGGLARPIGGLVSRRLFRCIALTCLLAPALAVSQPAGQSVLDEARQLIAGNRAAEAYRLLAQHEAGLAGQPLYDYLYGVAALDAGHAGDAITALERVLATDPASPGARLELGRAYYESGDRAAAERQFRALLAANPPASMRDTATAYLRAMEAAPARPSGWSGGFEFGSGYDSNANASTDDETFLGVTLDPDNVETSSPFLQLGGWLDHALPVGQGSQLATRARAGQRWNTDASFVNQTVTSLDTTLRVGSGPTVFSIGGGGYYGWLDGDAHHWGASVDVALSHDFGEGWRVTGLARAGTLRYDDDFASLSVMEVDQQLAALSLQRAGEAGYFGMTVFAGTDDPRESGSAYANDRLGVQLQAGSQNASGLGAQFQFGYQEVDYDATPGFFGTDRSDDIWYGAVAGELRDWPVAGMQLVPRIAIYKNDSNVALYQYDRIEFGLTLRRSFR
jgi:hypothetical protein